MTDPTGRHTPHEVTQLLQLAKGGDSRAAEELLPLVYEELRRLARGRMSKEAGGGAGQTLQATALVHEAYIRLLGPGGEQLNWEGRAHFFGAAARAMRRILIERARSRKRIKRGGDKARVELHDQAMVVEDSSLDSALELEAALTELEALDRRKAEVVMLRYFGGLSIEETAAALNVSPATVKNDWTFCRAWLQRRITQLMQGRPDGGEDSVAELD
jgi:RNA polymerase sigma factor (TIGR02999 family)